MSYLSLQDLGWSDFGDLSGRSAVIKPDEKGNVVRCRHVGIDTKGCMIYIENPDRFVAILGIRNIVVGERWKRPL